VQLRFAPTGTVLKSAKTNILAAAYDGLLSCQRAKLGIEPARFGKRSYKGEPRTTPPDQRFR
jgi:hypothetical protein